MRLRFLSLTLFTGLCVTSKPAFEQAPSSWKVISPGLTVRVSVHGRQKVIEYHAEDVQSSRALRRILAVRNPQMRTAQVPVSPHLKRVQSTPCTSYMSGSGSETVLKATINVGCATGTVIQGEITYFPVPGTIPQGQNAYTGTTHLGVIFEKGCTRSAQNPSECAGHVGLGDTEDWDIQEYWSSDDGQSGAAEQCGQDYVNCPANE